MPEEIPALKFEATRNQAAEPTSEATLKDLVGRLEKGRPQIALLEPSLDKNISELVERAAKPGLQSDVEFKTKLASALQAYEKLAGPVSVQPGTREELGRHIPTGPASENSSTSEPQISISREDLGIREVVAQLAQNKPHVENVDSRLSHNIGLIIEQIFEKPSEPIGPGLKTNIAYALQDIEKLTKSLNVEPALREELRVLAGTSPGLENQRMKDLLQKTEGISEPKLISDLRITAAEIAKSREQGSIEINNRLDVLEYRVRTAVQQGPNVGNAGGLGTPKSEETPAHQPSTGDAKAPPVEVPNSPSNPSADTISQIRLPVPAILGRVMSALQTGQPPTPPPWNGPQTPMADRVDSFEQKMQIRRDEKSFHAAESVGADALQAIRAFTNGPGASIMTKIEDAAKANPGGMQAVLSEMRDGGRYAELREQFNSALVVEKGFSAAYDKATAGLGQYGDQRTGLEQIFGRRNDAAALAGRFEKLDAEIGQAAAALPGKEDGKSTLEEMARKAAELLAKAVETVRSLFGHGADAGPREANPGAGI